jgi:hypothetical protein
VANFDKVLGEKKSFFGWEFYFGKELGFFNRIFFFQTFFNKMAKIGKTKIHCQRVEIRNAMNPNQLLR